MKVLSLLVIVFSVTSALARMEERPKSDREDKSRLLLECRSFNVRYPSQYKGRINSGGLNTAVLSADGFTIKIYLVDTDKNTSAETLIKNQSFYPADRKVLKKCEVGTMSDGRHTWNSILLEDGKTRHVACKMQENKNVCIFATIVISTSDDSNSKNTEKLIKDVLWGVEVKKADTASSKPVNSDKGKKPESSIEKKPDGKTEKKPESDTETKPENNEETKEFNEVKLYSFSVKIDDTWRLITVNKDRNNELIVLQDLQRNGMQTEVRIRTVICKEDEKAEDTIPRYDRVTSPGQDPQSTTSKDAKPWVIANKTWMYIEYADFTSIEPTDDTGGESPGNTGDEPEMYAGDGSTDDTTIYPRRNMGNGRTSDPKMVTIAAIKFDQQKRRCIQAHFIVQRAYLPFVKKRIETLLGTIEVHRFE